MPFDKEHDLTFITIGDLEDILSEFPTDFRLFAGDIHVYDYDNKYVGLIDIFDGKFEAESDA